MNETALAAALSRYYEARQTNHAKKSHSFDFIINDKLTFTYRKESQHGPEQFPYDKPMYLLLDMQLGGHWVGPIKPKELPYRYQIDYVRFYKRHEK